MYGGNLTSSSIREIEYVVILEGAPENCKHFCNFNTLKSFSIFILVEYSLFILDVLKSSAKTLCGCQVL